MWISKRDYNRLLYKIDALEAKLALPKLPQYEVFFREGEVENCKTVTGILDNYKISDVEFHDHDGNIMAVFPRNYFIRANKVNANK